MKDAAFQAYIALFRAGLLNDNLLPLNRERMLENEERVELPSVTEISEQYNPWLNIARAWLDPNLHQTIVSFERHKGGEEPEFSMVLTTPIVIHIPRPFPLYWNSENTYTVRLQSPQRVSAISSGHLQLMREITHTLLRSTHSDYKTGDRTDYVAVFTPVIENNQFETWLRANRGRRLALEEFKIDSETSPRGLVRSLFEYGVPHIFKRWHTSCASGAEVEVEVECSPLPRRRNFLHCGTLADRSVDAADEDVAGSARNVRALPTSSCTVDLLPFEQARFSLFIPAILQHVEVLMVADQLCRTVIKDAPIKDIHHITAAICATSAHWLTDYQRYEFIGDSILKFIVSSQLFVDHENWHEGYLSERRASLVSNSRLAKAALDVGLDAFILTKSFANRRWPHPRVSDLAAHSSGRRSVSSKTLADVVEALIGAAFIDGGLSSARACIHSFLPEIHVQATNFELTPIAAPLRRANSTVALAHRTAELLIGYQFLNKTLLVEALTHPSCERDTFTESYQRLEFLGDAVLDAIVVSVLSEHKSDCSHGEMTSIKAALVNAELLAFLCMEYSWVQDTVDIQQKNGARFYEVHGERQIELWKFMRHHCQDITKAQQACLERFQKIRPDVQHCLRQGKSYPWALLAELNADKFYSDMVESVLGAIFVDSKGNLEQCRHFAERIGILPYLRRILLEGIDIVHPKTMLGRMAAPNKIEYVVDCEENVRSVYSCLVRIKDKDVTTVGGCLSRDEALVKAAHAAVELISRTGPKVVDSIPQDCS